MNQVSNVSTPSPSSTSQKTTAASSRSRDSGRQLRTVAPFVDVYENDDELLLLADVPGVNPESVNVHLEKGQLTIEAERTRPTLRTAEGDAREPTQVTFQYRRAFTVPRGIDASKIDARLEAGVLHVRLPKSEQLKPRRIEVKTA